MIVVRQRRWCWLVASWIAITIRAGYVVSSGAIIIAAAIITAAITAAISDVISATEKSAITLQTLRHAVTVFAAKIIVILIATIYPATTCIR